MANREHISILEKGVSTWNEWRATERESVDLSYSDLSDLDLSGANLDYADLSESEFVRTKLRDASLILADLTYSDLTGANLSECQLIKTLLIGCKLKNTNFRNAMFHLTVLSDLDLTSCRFLHTCKHTGSSSIDTITLTQSGHIPLEFLRGIGLSDTIITYLPSLSASVIRFYSCFISYSTEDTNFVTKFNFDLQNQGVRCWYAPEDMKIDDRILDSIDEAVRLRDKVLLILSKASIESNWVEDEVTKAFSEERQRNTTVLFPIRIDDAVFSTTEAWAVKLRDNRNIDGFRDWKKKSNYRKSLDRLLRDLKASL